MTASAKALQEEIAFWQALIERRGEQVPAEALERMLQARSLAIQRLLRTSRARHCNRQGPDAEH